MRLVFRIWCYNPSKYIWKKMWIRYLTHFLICHSFLDMSLISRRESTLRYSILWNRNNYYSLVNVFMRSIVYFFIGLTNTLRYSHHFFICNFIRCELLHHNGNRISGSFFRLFRFCIPTNHYRCTKGYDCRFCLFYRLNVRIRIYLEI